MSKANDTDGGNETESADEYDVPIPGLMAVDTDEGGKGVIVYRRGLTAEEQQVAATGQSIAEHNPEHPPDAPTVGLVYKEALEERWGEAWHEWPASYLAFRAGNEGMRAYDFPVTRLAWGEEYDALTEDEDAEETAEAGGPYVSCEECDFSADEGETKADYAEHFAECPECGGDLNEVMTDGGVTLKRGRPTRALGGGARKDHLFQDKRSLCGKYMWGGGHEVSPEDVTEEDEELCKKCARSPEVGEVTA